MKITFVGGGAHRLVGILRGALFSQAIRHEDEIHLHDLNVERAEVVGRILMKSPEFAAVRCRVTWGSSLNRALEGADAVGVILMAGSPRTFALGSVPSWKHGFIASDNVSPNGALLAVKGAPILLDIAKRMERLCPDALLLDFANPVAVFSGMINRHTKVRALGVCQGYTNHYWDLSRLLGTDELNSGFQVDVAGINHLSFIVEGRLGTRDLSSLLDRRLARGLKMPQLSRFWSAAAKANIRTSIRNLYRFYTRLGVLIFSTEGDGMNHLAYEEDFALETKTRPRPTIARQLAGVAAQTKSRMQRNRMIARYAAEDLTAQFWVEQDRMRGDLSRQDHDIFVKILKGLSSEHPIKIVASGLNHGSIRGLPYDAVVECSQSISKKGLKRAGSYELPSVVRGMVGSLAIHQTMLGDACAANDPKLLAHALLAYPIRPYSRSARSLYRELIELNRDEIPPSLTKTVDYLN